MTLNKYILPIGMIAVLLITVLAAQATGHWQVSGAGQAIPTTSDGQPDPQGIKGRMTLAEIIEVYQIPQADLYAALELPADLPTSTQLKEIEKIVPGFEVSRVRELVTEYNAGR